MTSPWYRAALALSLAACSGTIGPGDPIGPAMTPPGGGALPPSGPSSPMTTTPTSTTPGGATCGAAARRIWALTPAQYARTVQALLPGAADLTDTLSATVAVEDGFINQADRLDMTEPHVGQLLDSVWKIAGDAAAAPAALAPCLAQPDAACVRGFVAGFGARAFRRDLAAAEIDGLASAFQTSAAGPGGAGQALRELLMSVLTSPSFLYRTELGPETATAPGPVTLTPFEKAAALSYFLTDGPPDAELLAAARTGALATPQQIAEHTRRLLRTPPPGLLGFFNQSLGLHAVVQAEKDPAVYPAWTPALAASLASQADALLDQVLRGDGKLSTLLTASATPERAGFLTLAGPMAALAKNNDTDPVARGKFVREALLCQALPPPPPTVNAVPPPPDGKRSQRQRLGQHSADPTCAGCHALMDPLGLAFERYDGVGAYRTTDLGQPIDSSGRLTGAEPDQAPFSDAVELMSVLAHSPTVASCFVATAFRYAQGRGAMAAGDDCALRRLGQRFQGSGGDIVDLMVALTTDESFFLRAGNP